MFFKKFSQIIILFILIVFFPFKFSLSENLLLMVTSEYCLYCKIWEKQIGKIYPKTDIAKKYPLKRVNLEVFLVSKNFKIKKTNITPTFVFLKKENELGRIEGYSSPEMFWWQVDEILER